MIATRSTKRAKSSSKASTTEGVPIAKRNAEQEELKTFRNLMTFRLHQLGGDSERLFDRYYLELFGLNRTECRTIGFTGDAGPASLKAICEAAKLEKGYASRIINRLVERGILHKEGNPDDQRSVLVSLTAAGRKLHRDLHRATVTLNQRMLDALTPEQGRTFLAGLVAIQQRVHELEEDTGMVREAAAASAGNERAVEVAAEREVAMDLTLARQLHQTLGRLIARDD